jgi:iron(III) transport system substrate-binding protein
VVDERRRQELTIPPIRTSRVPTETEIHVHRRLTKRNGLTVLSAGVMAAALAACGGGSEEPSTGAAAASGEDLVIDGETVAPAELVAECEEQGNEIHIYSAAPAEQYQLVLDEFKEDTGITLTQTRAGSSEIYSKVEAEAAGGRLTADLIGLNDPTLREALREKGIIQEFDTPLSDKVADVNADPTGYSQPSNMAQQVIVWNSAIVDEDEAPKSYEDLLDPKWKGKVGMTAVNTGLSSITVAKTIWDTMGEDYVRDLAEHDVRIYESVVPLTQSVLRGEIPVAITDLSITETYIEEGNPLAWVAPEEGTPSWQTFVMVAADTDKLACAKIYLSWSVTDKAANAYYEHTGFLPVMLKDNPPAEYPEIGNQYEVDFDWLMENRDSFVAEYQEITGQS